MAFLIWTLYIRTTYHHLNIKYISITKHTFDYSEIFIYHILISACELSPSDLVEFILQQTGIQAQLAEAFLLHRLNDTVHLCVVHSGQVGKVNVRRDQLFAQFTGV